MRLPRIRLLPVVALAALGSSVQCTVAQETRALRSEGALTFDLLFGESPGGRLPSEVAWSPDGSRLTYRWSDADGEAIWLLEPGGEPRPLLRLSELQLPEAAADADRNDFELDAYRWSPAGDELLIESDDDLFTFSIGDGTIRRLTRDESTEEQPTYSPDAGRIAFSRDADLWVVDRDSGRETALTRDGEAGRILNGSTSWVYWEEIWGRSPTAFWWSPDSRRIAYYRFDEREVERYPVVDFLPLYPQVREQPYPKAGGKNPEARIGVVDVTTRRTVWMQTDGSEESYAARVDWHPDGQHLAIQRLNREQNRLDLLLCDADSGRCDEILSETWPTWVNLSEDLTFLADGRFIWSSEKSGWRGLFLHDASGEPVRRLTPETVTVTALLETADDGSWVVYSAYSTTSLGAATRKIYSVSTAGGEPVELTLEEGWNSALVAPESGHFVHRRSTADRPETVVVRDRHGAVIAELPSEGPTGYDPEELPSWEFLEIEGPDDSLLPAALLKPADFDPSVSYPVIMYHYGCPASQVVADRWGSRGRGLWHKMMAERGYVVFSVDNGGSLFFGKHGEDRAHRRFGEGNLAAQLAGFEYLTSQSWVDAERIGLWGWSGGGSNTLYAMLRSPGTWAAGMAGAPVTDWHLYDTIWTERYLDHPEDNPDGYIASSAITYAADLADPLLLVHGMGDDNVHPQNSLVLMQKFVEAQVPFEQAIYPQQKHGFRGAYSRHFYERMTEFFDRHLGSVPPEVG